MKPVMNMLIILNVFLKYKIIFKKMSFKKKKVANTFIEADARLYCSAEFLINRWYDAMPMRVYNSERLPEEKWSTLICIIFFFLRPVMIQLFSAEQVA